MISDYQILGIPDNSSLSDIKRAYHLRAKQLHPDTTQDEPALQNHFLFVEVCKAYQRLLSKYDKNERELENTIKIKTTDKQIESIVQHADPAYVYYKNGIKLYSKIHPSSWKITEKSVIMTEIGDDKENQKLSQNIVKDLITLFPKAYYYFSIVVNEYPKSNWTTDAKEKMDTIEKRMERYKNIIESFTSWKQYIQNEKDRFNKMMKETSDNYANKYDEMNKSWNNKA